MIEKKKDLRKQIKEVNDKIIAIETGIETDEYDTNPSLATPTEFEQLEKEVDEEDADSDDRNIAELEKELEDANKKLSEANAEEEELNEMQEESDNDSILAKVKVCKGITADHAKQNICLNELIGLLTTRIKKYKKSGDSQILINHDELLLKFNRLSIEYNNKYIETTELKKKAKEGVKDENMDNFKKSLSEIKKISDARKQIYNIIQKQNDERNRILNKIMRMQKNTLNKLNISKSIKSTKSKLLTYSRAKKDYKYTNPQKLRIGEKIESLNAELEGLKEKQKILDEERELFKGGRTRRMKKNVKKITNKKKTSIKAKTRRFRRRITTCRDRKTFRRRN